MVRKMQTKLHCWAAGDPGRPFDDLYNLVCDPAFLVVAWKRVAGNAGARMFQPVEVRQVEIPKPSGKLRKLGIRR